MSCIGFDRTGRYYSELKSEMDRENGVISIVVYRLGFDEDNEERGVLENQTIILVHHMNFGIFQNAVYDPFLMRWYMVTLIDDELVILTGCLEMGLFERPPDVIIAEESYDVITSIPGPLNRFFYVELHRNIEFDEFLVIVIHGGPTYFMKFDNENNDLTLFKRIRIEIPTYFNLGIFFDFQNNIVYSITSSYFRSTKLRAINYMTEDRFIALTGFFYATQLWNSIFLTVDFKGQVRVFDVLEDQHGSNPISVFNLPTTHKFNSSANFSVFKRFDRVFLVAISCDENNIVFVFDIKIGKCVLEYDTAIQFKDWKRWYPFFNPFEPKITFNWNLTEIALFEPCNSEKQSILCFIDIGPFDLSLKHAARLSCLKWFNEDFLNQNLPVCLRKYLGVWKEH